MNATFQRLADIRRDDPAGFDLFFTGFIAGRVHQEANQETPRALPCASASTLDKVFAVYRRCCCLQPGSVRNNLNAMLVVIARASGMPRPPKLQKNPNPDPAKIRLDLINENLVQRFQEATVKQYIEGITDPTERRERIDVALRTSKSILKQARSLWSGKDVDWIARYRAEGIAVPECVNGFLKCKLRGRMRTEYKRASDEAIRNAFQRAEALRTTHVPTYLAFHLASASLRRSDIYRLRWEMIVERNGEMIIEGLTGKNGRKAPIPVQPAVAKILRDFRKPSGRVVECYRVDRLVNRFLRSCGFTETRLGMHELRAWIGSKVYEQNPRAAMQLLRHSSLTTTERSYGRYVTPATIPAVL